MRRTVRPDSRSRLHTPDRRSTPTGRPLNSEPRAAGRRAERAVLVSVLLPNTKADLRDPLAELAALTESAGVRVVDAMVQKRTQLTSAYALGKGKLAELVERVQAGEADVVIFDNDLAPRQIRGLEKALDRRVIDRSELILDIFAARAKTREAQLQVELAQLEYTSPRLRGLWTHLERIAGGGTGGGVVGGVGTRGPGERQIEIDRRIVRERISCLKREIREIDERKRREVRARRDQFTVSLVGYTNSGKTTLMNKLTRAEQFAADMLFATLDTKTVRWQLGDGQSALLSDTVGFVRDLPHGLVASFRATLEEAIHSDLLLHVVDVSSLSAWQQMESVDEVLTELGCDQLPRIIVLNKVDIADDASLGEMLSLRKVATVSVSALTGEGLDRLVDEVVLRVKGDAADVTIYIPHFEGKLIAQIGQLADVRGRRYLETGVELDIRMNRKQLVQLCGRHPALSIVKGDLAPVDIADAPDESDDRR